MIFEIRRAFPCQIELERERWKTHGPMVLSMLESNATQGLGSDGWERPGGEGASASILQFSLSVGVRYFPKEQPAGLSYTRSHILLSVGHGVVVFHSVYGRATAYSPLTPHTLEISLFRR